MSVGMSVSITFFMIVINTGFAKGFILRWVNGSLLGIVVAFPIALLLIPLVRKLVDKITSTN